MVGNLFHLRYGLKVKREREGGAWNVVCRSSSKKGSSESMKSISQSILLTSVPGSLVLPLAKLPDAN